MNNEIKEHRKKASDLSLGSSNDAIYAKALEWLKKWEIDSLLDFGSGQGLFLEKVVQEVKAQSFMGSDLMGKPDGLSDAIEWLQCDLNNKLELSDDSVSVISSLEVIEHLENPRHIFRELYRILKPGGFLVMSTPNVESWRSILSFIKRGHFVAFTDRSYPAHITPLNRKDLMRAAGEAGFKLHAWDYTHQGCVPGWTSMTWQRLSMGSLKGLRYSDNLFIILTK